MCAPAFKDGDVWCEQTILVGSLVHLVAIWSCASIRLTKIGGGGGAGDICHNRDQKQAHTPQKGVLVQYDSSSTLL